MFSVDTLPFFAPDDSPDAAPETPNNMDICCSEGAEGKAPNGGGQCGDSVPRWHHDSSRSHSTRGQKSVLGVCYRWLWHWLWHIFWLDSCHEPVYHCAHQRIKRRRRWRGGAGRSVSIKVLRLVLNLYHWMSQSNMWVILYPHTPHHNRVFIMCSPPAGIWGSVLTLWFMCFLSQGPSVTEMSRRAPKRKPTRTWLKSYLYTARTATCPWTGGATIFQVKALTSWSLIIPTHYGEIKLFTTEFITVPEMPIYCLWMYTL